jgi:Tfp pilus assembly protein PilP
MRITVIVSALTIVWGLAAAVPAGAQQAPGATATPESTSARAVERAAYDPAGRRDPFVSLALSGTSLPTGDRPSGVRGLLISELTLRGIVQAHDRLLATVQGPDKRAYTVAGGDELLDGTVKAITADAVVFLQRVDDPLSPIKQREIRKTLRTTEENR